jgi:hypothetical protein
MNLALERTALLVIDPQIGLLNPKGRDAVAGPKLPEGDGYLSALINFRRIANALWTTEETVKRLGWTRPDTPHGLTRRIDAIAKGPPRPTGIPGMFG